MIAQASNIRTSSSSRHLVGALNTRKIGKKIRTALRKSKDGGFGIKIAERDNMYGMSKPIFITAIVTNGSAHKDGRLREGDMLLEVNGVDLAGKSQSDVTKMLKGVSTREDIEFVVSRQEDIQDEIDQVDITDDNQGTVDHKNSKINHNHNNIQDNPTNNNDCDNDTSLIDLDVPDQEDLVFDERNDNHRFEKKVDKILDVTAIDGPGIYVYDVPLNETAGLGLYLKYPSRRSTDRHDLGIWIENVITGGAAYKDGRLQPHDQILRINGIDLVGLSNSEATEKLTAAVSRGIGPEAMPNTVRLNIQRREPAVVERILNGTNARDPGVSSKARHKNRGANKAQIRVNSAAEYTNLPPIGQENSTNSTSLHKNNSSKESYQKALENTIQNRSTLVAAAADTSSSSSLSNRNSHNDSALSPQTQASNSLKLSHSHNDRLNENNSDKTNDTSSAISQITDYTNVPTNDLFSQQEKNNILDNSDRQHVTTLPKSLQLDEDDSQNVEQTSTQSWDDDESNDQNAAAASGEEHFQRDGFGRQSISEKRHAQLMAKNTDTYRRNKQQREERERQRQLEEQLARQRLDDNNTRKSLHLPNLANNHKIPTSYTTNEFKSIYGLHSQPRAMEDTQQHDESVISYHREVPVDVYPTGGVVEPFVRDNSPRKSYTNIQAIQHNNFIDRQSTIPNSQIMPNITHHQMLPGQAIVQHYGGCFKCGSIGPCDCEMAQHPTRQQQHQIYNTNPSQYDHELKRSTSLESIQQHQQYQIREGLIVPRSGTVRVARNRKVNESFRVAVDRSYEMEKDFGSNEIGAHQRHGQPSQPDYHRRLQPSNRVSSSIANSTITSNSNDEKKYLIKKVNGTSSTTTTTTATSQKKTSLLTKFLKFGSMKRIRNKNKNRETQSTNSKTTPATDSATTTTSRETKSTSRDATNRELDTTQRSQLSSAPHSRTQSSQSHPNLTSQLNNQQHYNSHPKTNPVNDGQLYQQNLQQGMMHSNNQIQSNGSELYLVRPSNQSNHYQQVHNSNNTQSQRIHHNHNNHPQHHLSMTQAKFAQNVANRPVTNHHIMNEQQYSHAQMYPPSQPLTSTIPPQATTAHTNHPLSHHQHHHHHHHLDQQSQMPAPDHLVHNHYPYATTSQHRGHAYPNSPQVDMTNGACQQLPMVSQSQWQSPLHQAPNGLWVANSPVSSSETSNTMQPNNNIHHHHQHNGTHQRNVANMLHQQQQQLRPPTQALIHQQQMGQPSASAFIPPTINGHTPNGMPPSHQTSILDQSCPYTMPPHHLHHHQQQPQQLHNQPPHIYYYNF